MPEREIRAAILAVGTELTEGVTQDSHGRFLAGLLGESGILVREIVLIPDDRRLFVEELKRLAERAQVVVVSGGLGPTSDDLSREVVAEAAGVELRYREELWRLIVERFAPGSPSETNRRQAYIPEGFEVIANPRGTAPGFWGRLSVAGARAIVVALPGPPGELRPMATELVMPLLRRELGSAEPATLAATSFLVAESTLEEKLAEARLGEVAWSTRAEHLKVAFTLRGGQDFERTEMLRRVRERLGPLRIRDGEVEAERLLLDALRARRMTIALAESCTGGLGAKLLTDIPGASDSVWGAFVVYSNDAKVRQLGVPRDILDRYGAVSRETAASMAQCALDRSGADVSYAVTGIAGPGGGSPEKPVGTVWIAVGRRGREGYERGFRFAGSRDMVRRRSAVAATLVTDALLRGGDVDNKANWEYS